ncbi:MAG: SAM-dependent methyltransferase [Burkholderiaceae bacterium]
MPPLSASTLLQTHIQTTIQDAGGWLPFDLFMAQALYAPGLGYYANDLRKFGLMPTGDITSGSDFVTAPELTPLFGQTLARQVAQALQQTHTTEIWEFGAGSGALAAQLLGALEKLGQPVTRYTIVDVSSSLRHRQQETLAALGDKFIDIVHWASHLPDAMQGVVVGNEVLDAMPVKLLARVKGHWHERGVITTATGGFDWQDRPTALRPPLEVDGEHDYLTEIHPQAEAFMRTLAQKLNASVHAGTGKGGGGAAFFIDYGFPEAEYFHPQRYMGTVMCHQGHQADGDPLEQVGLKDITAHVNFTGVALAAQEEGLATLGYTSQGRFLLNAGLHLALEDADLPNRANALKLINEHEMGELFKVIAFCTGEPWDALGFAAGDRTHTL